MKTTKFLRNFVASAALTVLSTSAALAGTLGDTVNATYYFPDTNVVYSDFGTAVVTAAGATLTFPTFFDVHVTDTQIIADHFQFTSSWTSAPFNGFKITDLTKAFGTTFSVDSSTNMAGFSASNVSITGNVASINWNGLAFTEDTVVTLNISAVPEPESYAMLLAGLGLMGVVLRQRKQA